LRASPDFYLKTLTVKGVQVGTIDALIARLCIHHELSLLTADRDFTEMSRYCSLDVLVAGEA